MTSDSPDGNGRTLMLGKLSGELDAVVRECQSCRTQQQSLHDETRQQLRSLASEMRQEMRAMTSEMVKINTNWSNHVVFHKTSEQAAAKSEQSAIRSEAVAQSSEDRETAGRRWSWTTTLQVFTTCAAVAAVIVTIINLIGR